MPFIKGQTPWNKGTIGLMAIPWNKGTKGITSGGFQLGHTVSDEIRKKMSIAAKKRMVKPGYVNPNYLPGVRDKIIKANTGKKRSLEARKKYSVRMLKQWHGDNWNKVIFTPCQTASVLRASVDYRDWRLAILKRDDYTCQICGIRGGKLEVDHLKSFANFPELRFNLDNGRTLCKSCHDSTKLGRNHKLKELENPNWGSMI